MLFVNENFKFAITIFVWCLICHLPVYSQNIDGSYTHSQEKIIINRSQIEYDLIAWGYCIHAPYSGSGTYKILNKRLYIEPNDIKLPQKSTIEKKEPLNSDTMLICNKATPAYPYFISFFGKNKQTYIIQSDTNGIGKVLRNKICNYDSICINYIGAKPVGTRLTKLSNYDFNVNIAFYKENDFHYDFITNGGKGFKIKVRSDKIYLKYNKRMKRHSKKQKYTWYRFNKIN